MIGERRSAIPRAWLILLLLGLLLRLFLIVVQPMHGSPTGGRVAFNDEASHFNHILLLKQTHQPGEQRMGVHDPSALERGEVEYSQPPLYYWMAAGLTRVIGTGDSAIILLRIASLLLWFGALHLLFYYAPFAGARLPLLIGGTLLGVGLIPSTTINNDSLFAFTIAGLYAFASLAGKREFSWLRLINLALLFAVAIWTKLAALALGPMVLAIAWVAGPKPKAGARMVLVAAISLWATLPLWLQRTLLYGSPLSIEKPASGGAWEFAPFELVKSTLYSLVMPWMELWGSVAVKLGMVGVSFLLLGAFLYGVMRWKEIRASIRAQGASTVTLLWMIGGLGSLAAWLYYVLRYQQSEARLLLPAAPALAVALGWQLWIYDGWVRRAFIALLLILMVLPYLALGVG